MRLSTYEISRHCFPLFKSHELSSVIVVFSLLPLLPKLRTILAKTSLPIRRIWSMLTLFATMIKMSLEASCANNMGQDQIIPLGAVWSLFILFACLRDEGNACNRHNEPITHSYSSPPSPEKYRIPFRIDMDSLNNHNTTKPVFNVGPSMVRQQNAI